jgi:hypothetical protein
MEADLCVGCLRTLDEIARWGGASECEQQAILAAVASRRQETSPTTEFGKAICLR